jgi:acetyl esterase/lipase
MKKNILLAVALVSASTAAFAQSSIEYRSHRADRPGPYPVETYGIAPDGAILTWVVHTPKTPGPWPIVLVIHGGFFSGGTATDAGTSRTSDDLAAAGYLALAITHRLDRDKIQGQTSSGVFPEQTDDCKTALLAARADPRGTGKIGVIGGSSGGSHAVFLAVTGTEGTDKADVAVSLSGAYLFSDPQSLKVRSFASVVTRYANCSVYDTVKLNAASPAAQPTLATASPMLLIASVGDTMPDEQLPAMTAALDAAGNHDYAAFIYDDIMDHHSFDIWPFVRDMSIAFLDDVLKD